MESRVRVALCLCALSLLASVPATLAQACEGRFDIMGDIGISPITALQSPDGPIYLFDRRDLQNSKIVLGNGAFGHAVEYYPDSNTWRTIDTVTNTWCSAGGSLSDGTLINTSGNDNGTRGVRILRPCSLQNPTPLLGGTGPASCDQWWEDATKFQLATKRWYPTQQVLPDGRHILIGGSSGGVSPNSIAPNYEFLDPFNSQTGQLYSLPFLGENKPNYLYPFTHLLPSDYLFIFANTAGIIFNYKTSKIAWRLPNITGGISRSYPNTAASLLLPIDWFHGFNKAEILICGGNNWDAGRNTQACSDCYMIDVSIDKLTRKDFLWRGPFQLARPRVMPDLLFLANGKFLLINGAQLGVAGFNAASIGNLYPEILARGGTGVTVTSNFCPSTITRGYHSEAVLIPDGRVLIAGSNAWGKYTIRGGDPFSTEYRIEMWSPPYLLQTAIPRPTIRALPTGVIYQQQFTFTFDFPSVPSIAPGASNVRVSLISNAFTTHSLSMHLRLLDLAFSVTGSTVTATAPPSNIVAPPGPYMLVLVYRDIPSIARWIYVKNA